jgi:hypothetical protein
MLEYVGVSFNEVGAILLSIAAVVPSRQEVLKIWRGGGIFAGQHETEDLSPKMPC